jgi:hypothetical protein
MVMLGIALHVLGTVSEKFIRSYHMTCFGIIMRILFN